MEITGTVKDKATGETLPNAAIYFSGQDGVWLPGTTGTLADENGNFTISKASDDKNYLTATYTGYANKAVPVAETINFKLSTNAILPAVNITGTMILPRVAILLLFVIILIWILKPFK